MQRQLHRTVVLELCYKMIGILASIELFIFSVYILLIAHCDPNDKTLELVHVIFRHGSRTNDKQEVYPNDPYGPSNFHPLNYGQLTNHGKQQAYQLGKLLRRRYNDFLDGDIPSNTVWAESTSYERTQMTALLVLAGLFPPTVAEKWNDDLNWTPIPYYSRKSEHDFVIRKPTGCPVYKQELKQFLKSEEVSKFLQEHSETFTYITEHSGKQINDLVDIFRLHQVLDSEATRNLTLPDWTKKVFPVILKVLATQKIVYENYTPLLRRLNAGRLLKVILNRMNKKSENAVDSNGKKLILYSGHDNNVLGTLVTLDLAPYEFPEYCSAVLIELHKRKDSNESYVKVFHLRDVLSEPEEKQISNCNGLCSLSQFNSILRPHLPENLTEECGSSVLLE